jgi:hypothetical protein
MERRTKLDITTTVGPYGDVKADSRDHVELPEDYLEKAKEIYSFQASHPVDEKLRGQLSDIDVVYGNGRIDDRSL